MRRKVGWVAIVVAVGGIGLQLVPLEYPPDNPPAEATISGPAPVVELLRRTCVDCHSNETRWPFYAYVAPLSWGVTGDVAAARSRMNFSEWEGLRAGFKRRFSRKIVERVEKREMPLPRYLWLHWNARVTDQELEVLRAWRDELNGNR